ncbi:MAG: hypothetical protein A4E30_00839 [Methanomassiliicoccales archaeon PtaB.Bin215]|nr:MAG: hypothetical protein A4E30_00839 [Methanomassiliicoccales archaeon PtaB.Bin215]
MLWAKLSHTETLMIARATTESISTAMFCSML